MVSVLPRTILFLKIIVSLTRFIGLYLKMKIALAFACLASQEQFFAYRMNCFSLQERFHMVGYRTAGPTSAEGTSFNSSSINCLMLILRPNRFVFSRYSYSVHKLITISLPTQDS